MKTLKEALEFVLIAQGKGDREFHKHCNIKNGYVSATDGVISAACRIEEDLNCKPNTGLLISALSKCKKEINITQLNESFLSVKSGRFKAKVPCFELDLPAASFDAEAFGVNSSLLKCISKLLTIAAKSQNDRFASVFIKGGSAFATDGRLLIEIWHGENLPTFSLPIDSCKRLLKVKGSLCSIGCSEDSATFYFDNETVFRTPLSSGEFPLVDELLNVGSSPIPLDKEIVEGFRSVAPFCEIFVKFESNLISSVGKSSGDATFEIDTPANHSVFSTELFSMIANDIASIDFNTSEQLIYFFGDNMRGALAKGRE